MKKSTIITISIIFMIVGGLGMGISSLAVFSSSMMEVIGAGLGFVTGAVLMGSGLIAMAIVLSHSKGE